MQEGSSHTVYHIPKWRIHPIYYIRDARDHFATRHSINMKKEWCHQLTPWCNNYILWCKKESCNLLHQGSPQSVKNTDTLRAVSPFPPRHGMCHFGGPALPSLCHMHKIPLNGHHRKLFQVIWTVEREDARAVTARMSCLVTARVSLAVKVTRLQASQVAGIVTLA